MLKALMLRREIDRKKQELEGLRGMDDEFVTREAELEQAINETETDDQREAVADEVEKYEAEKSAHEQKKDDLNREIEELEGQLSDMERNAPKPTTKIEEKVERSTKLNINIRSLPANKRAIDAIPTEERNAILGQEDVKNFLTQLRSMKGQNRAVSGGELLIPVVMLDLIAENMYRYSKLINRVRVRVVNGEARQTVAGIVPEAIWQEMCGAINELTFTFGQWALDGYKVAGYIPVCNALLEDNDINLAGFVVEMLSESIGLALDKAILYGKGSAYNMPMGIVTRLAQSSKPASYPTNAPAWTDLHSSNLLSISNSLTGAEFWAALQNDVAACYTKYSRGNMFWAMNSKTYAKLKSKAITFTAAGDVVANVYGILPIVTGDIDILEFMPDNDIVGGYGDLYLLAQRSGMTIEASRECQFIADNTVFRGKMRADGVPVIAGAFVGINIAGSSVTTTMTFAADTANDAKLQSLKVGTLSLNTTFDPDTLTYTASAASNVTKAAVVATPAQPDASVSITATAGTTTVNVVNGAEAALSTGANVIDIEVKNGNEVKVYTVTVTRAS